MIIWMRQTVGNYTIRILPAQWLEGYIEGKSRGKMENLNVSGRLKDDPKWSLTLMFISWFEPDPYVQIALNDSFLINRILSIWYYPSLSGSGYVKTVAPIMGALFVCQSVPFSVRYLALGDKNCHAIGSPVERPKI